MQFSGSLKEHFWLSSLAGENGDILKQAIKTGLTIFWNLEENTSLSIDGIELSLKHNQIIFLTEFHKVHIQSITNCFKIMRSISICMSSFDCISLCNIFHNVSKLSTSCSGSCIIGTCAAPKKSIPLHSSLLL